jgi:hypothetical protein
MVGRKRKKIVCMGLVRKLEGKRPLEKPSVDGMMVSK